MDFIRISNHYSLDGLTYDDLDLVIAESVKYQVPMSVIELFRAEAKHIVKMPDFHELKERFLKKQVESILFAFPDDMKLIQIDKGLIRVFCIEYVDCWNSLNFLYQAKGAHIHDYLTDGVPYTYLFLAEWDNDFKKTFDGSMVMPAEILTFLFFFLYYRISDITVDIVKGGYQSNKLPKSTKSEFTHLSKSYFRRTIVDAPFCVTGHWRNQAYGPGRKLRRKIFIKEFIKNGYNKN